MLSKEIEEKLRIEEERLRIEAEACQKQILEAERREKINIKLENCYEELREEKRLLEILRQKQINFKNRLTELENKSRTEGEKMKNLALEALTKMETEIFDNPFVNVDSSFVNEIMQFKQNEKDELLSLTENEETVLMKIKEKEENIEKLKSQISNLRTVGDRVLWNHLKRLYFSDVMLYNICSWKWLKWNSTQFTE